MHHTGLMQFIDKQNPGQMYTITDADPPVIVVPYPPNEVQPINLPLRMALSRLVVGIITGEVIPNQWMIITCLVPKDQLELVFSAMRNALTWETEGIDTPLREALCWL